MRPYFESLARPAPSPTTCPSGLRLPTHCPGDALSSGACRNVASRQLRSSEARSGEHVHQRPSPPGHRIVAGGPCLGLLVCACVCFLPRPLLRRSLAVGCAVEEAAQGSAIGWRIPTRAVVRAFCAPRTSSGGWVATRPGLNR